VLSALLCSVALHAEEFTDAPTPQKPATKVDKTLRFIAWPSYALVPKYTPFDEDRSKLGRTEEFVLAAERFGFLADATTTARGLGNGHESNPMNTMFGNQSRIGVVGSMTAWELAFGYSSVMVPHWFDHTRYRKTARIAAIVGGSALTGLRVKSTVQNLKFQ
jgi:hypothetical protein